MTTTKIKGKGRVLAFGLALLIAVHVGMAKADWGGLPIIPNQSVYLGPMTGPFEWGLDSRGTDNLYAGAASWFVDWTALMEAYSSWSDAVQAAAAAEEENSSETPGPIDIPIPACCDGDDCYEYLDSLLNSIDRGMTALYTLRRIRSITLLKARAYQSMIKAAGEFSPLAGAVYHAKMFKPVTEAEEIFRTKYNSKTTLILGKIDAKYKEIGEIIDQQCSDTGWYLKNAWALNKTLHEQFVW